MLECVIKYMSFNIKISLQSIFIFPNNCCFVIIKCHKLYMITIRMICSVRMRHTLVYVIEPLKWVLGRLWTFYNIKNFGVIKLAYQCEWISSLSNYIVTYIHCITVECVLYFEKFFKSKTIWRSYVYSLLIGRLFLQIMIFIFGLNWGG